MEQSPSPLRARRRELGHTLAALGLAVGVSPSRLSRVERGLTVLPDGLASRVALALGVDPVAFFGVRADAWTYLPPLPRPRRRRGVRRSAAVPDGSDRVACDAHLRERP